MFKITKILIIFIVITLFSTFANADLKILPLIPETNRTDRSIGSDGGGYDTSLYYADENDLIRRSLINFSRACDYIPAGYEITNLTWEVKGKSGAECATPLSDIVLYPISHGWNETVTWSQFNNGGTAGVDYDNTNDVISSRSHTGTICSTRANISLDLTYIQDLCNDNLGQWYNGVLLLDPIDEADTDASYSGFYSTDDANGWSLYIEYETPLITEGTYNFTFTANDLYDNSAINSFGVTLTRGVNSYYVSTESGTAHITNGTIPLTEWNKTYNIKFNSSGYYNISYSNINLTNLGSTNGKLTKHFRAITTFRNYITKGQDNYTRILNYTVNVTCLSGTNTSIQRYINGTFSKEVNITCIDYTNHYINGTYQHNIDGNYTLFLTLNTSKSGENSILNNGRWVSDITNPTAIINYTVPSGFTQARTNVTLICNDLFYNLTYNVSFNTETLFYGNKTTGNHTNETSLNWGSNTAIGTCKDLFGSTIISLTRTIYATNIYLIDEKENALFNLDNCSSARVYFDDNQTYHDFKTTNNASVNFTIQDISKLRFEFEYIDGTIITRYVDISLFENQDLRVCVNKEGTTHYQQLILSATEKVAILKNLFSNCVIAADYTRFAYQDTLLLQASSIESLYYLYTFDDNGNQLFLAAVDGSLTTYINLDQIEFGSAAYNLDIQQNNLAFQNTNDDEIKIYYKNLEADNTALDLTITRMDLNNIVFNTNEFTNYNEFTLYFDYSTLNITNETLFKLDLVRTTANGEETLTRYFNTAAKAGTLQSIIVFVISFLLMIFGLTITASRYTLGYFGIGIVLASMGVLSLGLWTWYNIILLALEVIILCFIGLNLVFKNYSTLT